MIDSITSGKIIYGCQYGIGVARSSHTYSVLNEWYPMPLPCKGTIQFLLYSPISPLVLFEHPTELDHSGDIKHNQLSSCLTDLISLWTLVTVVFLVFKFFYYFAIPISHPNVSCLFQFFYKNRHTDGASMDA